MPSSASPQKKPHFDLKTPQRHVGRLPQPSENVTNPALLNSNRSDRNSAAVTTESVNLGASRLSKYRQPSDSVEATPEPQRPASRQASPIDRPLNSD